MTKVEVTWLDAWSDGAYLDWDAVRDVEAATRTNVGYVMRDDAEVIVITPGIVHNLFEDRVQVEGIHVIPKCMVQEINELRT